MVIDIDNLTGGLVQLSYSGHTGNMVADAMLSGPLFYRILGRETTLLYTESLLKKPQETIKRGEKAYYMNITGNLDFLIDALDKETRSQNPNWGPEQQAVLTIENYTRKTNGTVNYAELREEFQSYRNLLENLNKSRKLTTNEEQIRERFLSLLRFFVELERRHTERKFFEDSDDDSMGPGDSSYTDFGYGTI